jgi:hypothetical protein
MKYLKYLPIACLALLLSGWTALAQSQRPDWSNMDPQQIQGFLQKQMMANFREQLAITNDAEWNIIEARLAKVSKLKMGSMFSSGAGMMKMFRRGGDAGGGGGGGGGSRRFPGLGEPDPDMEGLQKALDGEATSAQVKAALTKLRDARRQKQAELSKAQEDLRIVLTTRQEATLVLAGMLD